MGGTPWLDESEARAWRGFLEMQALLLARLNRQLQRDSGLSGADYAILVALSEATPSRLRARDLGRDLQWDKSRLSKQVSRMVERGLVAREACPDDQRGSQVVLTDAGRAAVTAAATPHLGHVRRWFVDVLDAGQLDAMAAISSSVLAVLDAPEPGPDGRR